MMVLVGNCSGQWLQARRAFPFSRRLESLMQTAPPRRNRREKVEGVARALVSNVVDVPDPVQIG
jgi:hypothetical protein